MLWWRWTNRITPWMCEQGQVIFEKKHMLYLNVYSSSSHGLSPMFWILWMQLDISIPKWRPLLLISVYFRVLVITLRMWATLMKLERKRGSWYFKVKWENWVPSFGGEINEKRRKRRARGALGSSRIKGKRQKRIKNLTQGKIRKNTFSGRLLEASNMLPSKQNVVWFSFVLDDNLVCFVPKFLGQQKKAINTLFLIMDVSIGMGF